MKKTNTKQTTITEVIGEEREAPHVRRSHVPPKLKVQSLDVTTSRGWDEVAAAFGPVAAWQAAITALRAREAKETDPRKKSQLRLQLYNAQAQLWQLKQEQKGEG